MSLLGTISLLIAFAASPIAYIAANVLLLRLLSWAISSIWESVGREALTRVRRFGSRQIGAVSEARAWSFSLLQSCALVGVFYLAGSERSLLSAAFGLAAYVVFVCAVSVSLLAKLPAVRSAWTDPAVKIVVWATPVAVSFLSRGFASGWVGDVIGVSAANAPNALLLATALFVALIVAIVLAVFSVFLEVVIVVGSTMIPRRMTKRHASSLLVLTALSFMSAFAGVYAARDLTTKLGGALLAASAFELDAGPAGPCELTDEEKTLSRGDEPFVRALYLSSSQEKALLIRRDPPLFRSLVLKHLQREDVTEKRISHLRVVACFSSGG